MSDVGAIDASLGPGDAPREKFGASIRRAHRMPRPPRRAYSAPVLVNLDLRVTQGDTGLHIDGEEGSLFTSGGGPQ